MKNKNGREYIYAVQEQAAGYNTKLGEWRDPRVSAMPEGDPWFHCPIMGRLEPTSSRVTVRAPS